MSNAARAGRRRRFLHEGSSESSNRSSSQSKSNEADASELATGNRYAHRADSASFAIAKGLMPQTWVTLSTTVLGLLGALAILVTAAMYGPQFFRADSFVAPEIFLLGLPGTISAWFASSLWLAIAGSSLVLFGVRRQRMDDLRCQYRWWLVAAFVALVMSLNASIAGHQYLANGLAQLVGWSPMPMNAFWWLVPAGLIAGGIAIRMTLDLAESRVALSVAILAMLTLSLGWGVEAGLMPNAIANISPILVSPLFGPTTSLAGTSLLLIATLLYSRHIVLEEQGVIAKPATRTITKPAAKPVAKAKIKAAELEEPAVAEKPTQRKSNATNKTTIEPKAKAQEPSESVRAPEPTRAERRAEEKRQKQAEAKSTASEPTLWVSGDDSSYQDEYEENGAPRKLTKAERKRLKKLKARHAA